MAFVSHMEIPVYSKPEVINELTDEFRECSRDVRQFIHFREIVSALDTSEKRSIAHLNSTIVGHSNESSMNRFLSSRMDTDLMFDTMIREINKIEDEGIIAIDDTIAEKNGKDIEAAGYIYDHSIGKAVWGIQFATAVFSGRYGIYPVSAIVYERKEKIDDEKKEKKVKEYRSKIDIQKSVIGRCISSGLHFSAITGDIWYFTKGLVSFLNEKHLSWVFQSKGNRKVKIKGR